MNSRSQLHSAAAAIRDDRGDLPVGGNRAVALDANAPTYTAVARRFHWWTAGLLAFQIPLGLYMAYRGGELNIWDATTNTLYSSHKLVGLIILGLTLSRLAYRLIHGTPPDERTIKPWQKIASHATHGLLYALLIGVALAAMSGFPFTQPWISLVLACRG